MLLEGKGAGAEGGEAFAVRLGRSALEIEVDGQPLAPMANLKLNLAAAGEVLAARDFYAKVIRGADGRGAPGLVYLTAVPPEIDSFLEALRRYATAGA